MGKRKSETAAITVPHPLMIAGRGLLPLDLGLFAVDPRVRAAGGIGIDVGLDAAVQGVVLNAGARTDQILLKPQNLLLVNYSHGPFYLNARWLRCPNSIVVHWPLENHVAVLGALQTRGNPQFQPNTRRRRVLWK